MNAPKSQPLRRHLSAALPVFLLLIAVTAPLHAHHLPPGMEDIDEFEHSAALMAGLRHPLLGLDHWMMALAFGWLAAALRSSKAGLAAAALFAAGGFIGAQGIVLPGMDHSFAVAALIVGFALALQRKIPLIAASSFLAAAALVSGNAHGIAWPIESASISYLAGLMVTSLALALIGFTAQRLTQARLATPALA